MELKDTVKLMESDDYRERFLAEFYQLKIRYIKLKNMLEKWDKGELDFTPACNRQIYDIQITSMETYLDVLADRAEIEGITLEEIKQ